jgi:membrane-anchored protein YejM (alkaline phosphatase superfamily)
MDPSSENVFEVSGKKRGRIFLTDEGRDVVNDLNGEPPSLDENTTEEKQENISLSLLTKVSQKVEKWAENIVSSKKGWYIFANCCFN